MFSSRRVHGALPLLDRMSGLRAGPVVGHCFGRVRTYSVFLCFLSGTITTVISSIICMRAIGLLDFVSFVSLDDLARLSLISSMAAMFFLFRICSWRLWKSVWANGKRPFRIVIVKVDSNV